MTWRRPRWSARLQPPVGHLLEEAHALGVVGRGAISTRPGALLADDAEGRGDGDGEDPAGPIDHFLLQADLTVVVPGPLIRDLADELDVVATIESARCGKGFTASARRPSGTPWTPAAAPACCIVLQEALQDPVPQGLTYLIDDVARRHVSCGWAWRRRSCGARIRCCWLRPSRPRPRRRPDSTGGTPTVAVSQRRRSGDVLAALRSAGLAPATGTPPARSSTCAPAVPRVPTPQYRRLYRPMPTTPATRWPAVVGSAAQGSPAPLRGRQGRPRRGRCRCCSWPPCRRTMW